MSFTTRCLACRHTFEYGTDAHPFVGGVMQCPACKGYDLETIPGELGERCDFCTSDPQPPAWVYPCADFTAMVVVTPTVTQEHKSAGEWVACEHHHELVERGSDALIASEPRAAAVVMWRLFFHHRTGPPIRIADAVRQ